jgi:uncharacterized protein (DUF736 family)
MTEYDNTNRGALFRNTKKETEQHPDHTGSLNVGGVDYWISGWVRESKSGQKYFSLSVRPKQPMSEHEANKRLYQAPLPTGGNDPDDEIPFARPACLDGLCFPYDGAWFGPTLTDFSMVLK